MIIKPVSWCDEVRRGLIVSCGDDLDIIRQEVEQKISICWCCQSDKNFAFVVTRYEPPNELVIVCGEGSGFDEFMPFFVRVARKHNLTVRTHIKRKGLLRMWARLGINFEEYVLRG